MRSILISNLLALVLLTGCTQTVYRPAQIPLVPRPALPHVSRAEVQCLAPDVYTRLVDRQNGYKDWGLQYEAEVKANNAKADANVHP